MLKHYVNQYQEEALTDIDSDDEDAAAEEKDEERAQEALDYLTVLFANKPQFKNSDVAHNYLTCTEPEEILKNMEIWIRELMQVKEIECDEIKISATTPEDLNRLIEPFPGSPELTNESINQASVRPVIQSARVHTSSALLESGIILVNLPGFSDINKYRLKVARECLNKCDHVIVVCIGKRMQSDTYTKDTIESVSKRKGSNMTLVVTHNDEVINSKNAKEAFNKYQRLKDLIETDKNLKNDIGAIKAMSKINQKANADKLQKLQHA